MGSQHERMQYDEVVILKLKGFSSYTSRPVLGSPFCYFFGTVHQSSNPPMVVPQNFPIALWFGQVLACAWFKLDAKVPNCCPSGLFILTSSWELGCHVGPPQASIDSLFQQIHLQVGVCTWRIQPPISCFFFCYHPNAN